MNWQIFYCNKSVESALLKLPATLLARYLRYTERMEKYGPDLGMPHTRVLGKGLFELRLKASEGIARVLYFTKIKNKIIIVHVFVKKTQKTPKKELEIAIKRMMEMKSDTP